MQSIDSFRANEHGILVATDAAARGLDIPGVRTVDHYQLPLSAEVILVVIAIFGAFLFLRLAVFKQDKFTAVGNMSTDVEEQSFSKESFQWFPVEVSCMPEITKQSSLAHQIDKIVRKGSQKKDKRSWLERNVESELNTLLSRPLQPRTFSKRFVTGSAVSLLLQNQFEEIALRSASNEPHLDLKVIAEKVEKFK
ncbi:RNA helicase [Salvia divinorum]|uniref:RNA helicase n=1 Tax=Salvia divinorum TaxID=28513 RepID=A0ABD1IHS1_SALDI